MVMVLRMFCRSLVVLGLMLISGLQLAFGDDTEIFVGGGDIDADAQPNVLFILDNSGSMDADLGDGSGDTRMEAMKDAFSQLVNTVENVNVGVMRFNTPGGAIAYPVTDVDTELSIPYVTNATASSSEDDASENQSGTVTVGRETHVLSYGGIETEEVSIKSPIQHEDDDAEENIGNGWLTPSSHLQFNMDSSQVTALRFYDLGIPAGATIVEAKIRFTSVANYTRDGVIRIEGEKSFDAERFDHDAQYNISSRPRTDARLDWQVTQDWFRNRRYYSPDVSNILQEIIDQDGWSENNAVAFIFDHQSGYYRSGYLYKNNRSNTRGLNGRASVLEVTYSADGGDAVQHTVGIRFQKVAIPKGARVTNAQINFTAAETNADPVTLLVEVQNSGDAQAFSAQDNNITDPIARPRYGSSVNWEVDGAWTADQAEPGPVVTDLVQGVVNHPDWCGNRSIAFFISGSGINNRKAYSFDAGNDREPKLVVEYEYDPDSAPEGTGCIEPIFASYLSAREHDASQSTRGSRSTDNNGNYLYINDRRTAGLRYDSIPLKQGAEIKSAHIKFTAYPDVNNSGNTTISIAGHATDNAPAFPEARRNITNRSLTSAKVAWSPEDWDGGVTYDSPDISSVIQEIVNDNDWQPGNSLALVLSSNSSNTRSAYSWDGSTSRAAQLVIQVGDGGIDNSGNTVAQHIDGVVQSLEPRTWTPIVDTLYEAALYFRGESMYYGKKRELFPQMTGRTDERYKRVSVESSYSGGSHVLPPGCPSTDSSSTACDGEEVTGDPKYISPITSACQSNHIVLLTDGQANNNHQPTRDAINAWTSGWKGRDCQSDSNSSSQKCSRDLVEWLANTDQYPAVEGYDNVINTHTIAFNLDDRQARDYLQELASLGGGLYKDAETAADLAGVFDEIIRSVLDQNATFVSPGATINQFNRLTHRNEIYFSLFKPDSTAKWTGNLKRYKLLGNPPVISDANDEAAVDSTTGFFKEDAKSVWSTIVDGHDVALGGAAYELKDPDFRKAYTFLSSAEGASKSLTAVTNQLHESNANITQAMLGVADEATRNNVLKWARGMDLKDWDGDSDQTEARLQIGDPLHSVPVLVTYGGEEDSPDIAIFVGTNEGFVHAINAKDGSEHFSFIPEPLLGNLNRFYENNNSYSHPYGMDGSPISWVKDVDFDGQIESSDGDHVYLYIGMRRGGNNYYALDVTNLNSPKILWTIEGGTGDFADLGQTWSKPVKTKIKIGESVKDVLVFAGGFDTNQDSVDVYTPDSVGNALYIVDAETGKRIWMAKDGATVLEGLDMSEMDYSIPGDVSVVDINQDGLADQIYLADVGGQIWRFDIVNGESLSDLVHGGVIARVGVDNNAAQTRRFFNKPNVSLFGVRGQQKLAVSIGSGTRFNPLNRVMVDRFYTLFLDSVYGYPPTYETLLESDLVDRTSADENDVITKGWYIDLPNTGEKVLANAVTVNNTIFFNTYTPDTVANSCQAVAGQGRTYAVSLFNANAAFDLDEDETIENVTDRGRLLNSGAIPPAPKLLISEEGQLTLLVGPEQPYTDQDLGAVRTDRWFNSYWYERDDAISGGQSSESGVQAE